jgi:hypothetical protein
MELVDQSVSFLRYRDITQKIKLLVCLPLVYLRNKLPLLFLTTYVHGIITKNLIPDVILSFNPNVIKGKGEVVPVHAMEGYRGSRGITPLILNLGSRWR